MSVAAILMTAAMPTWKQMARREKEAELIFRGQQYARAIGLFQRRSGPGVLPPNLDVLVEGRFLRKKYKDPITGEDFDLLTPTQGAAGVPTAGRGAGGQQQGGGTQQPGRGTPPGAGPVVAPAGGRGGAGGIIGVVSKSTETSIRVYNGRTKYNEWQFMYVAQTQAPEAPGAAGGVPGGRGSRAGGPGSPTAPGGFGPGAGRPGGRGPGRGAGPDGGQGRGGLQPGGLNGQPRAPIFGGPSPFGPQTPR